MERVEKGGERKKKKKQEFMGLGIKLKRGFLVGKRGGNCTPSPTWRLGFAQTDGSLFQDPTFLIHTTSLSARKLGANLWEVQPHLKLSKMSKVGHKLGHLNDYNHHKDEGFELPKQLAELPDSPPEQAANASSSKSHVAASLIQHHRPVPINGGNHGSSMEVAPYKPPISHASSIESKVRYGESNCNTNTSAELLKVLNRIWSLEEQEQHASNMSLVKALKRELDFSRARIKELLLEKQRDRRDMDELMKKIAEDNVLRKDKEHDRIKDVVKSVKEELENERKLRQQSESLHRKLAQELSEVKSSFFNATKELTRQRKARVLLEDLCDEFAKGIRDYEQEVRFLKHNPDKDRVARVDPDRLILHLSEAWLDERMQMKLTESAHVPAEKNTIVDKLRCEIETFLGAKHSVGSENYNDLLVTKPKEYSLCRHSLECFHLKEAASAPQNGEYDADSTGNDCQCFELNRGSVGKQRNGCIINEGSQERESKQGSPGELNSNYVLNGLSRHHASTLGEQAQFVNKSFDLSVLTGNASPLPKGMSRLATPDPEVSESPLKWPLSTKENTLKFRLLEARLENKQSRSKSKAKGFV